jgi:acetate kinase
MNHFTSSLALLVLASVASATGSGEIDTRINLHLTEAEKNEFLSEMRQMLASIQGIITGIGLEDRDLIVRSARYSGNRMARNTPQSVRQKLPQSFKELGGPTHLMFEELVIRAETDDMATLAEFTGQLMQQCLSCHAIFKVD